MLFFIRSRFDSFIKNSYSYRFFYLLFALIFIEKEYKNIVPTTIKLLIDLRFDGLVFDILMMISSSITKNY